MQHSHCTFDSANCIVISVHKTTIPPIGSSIAIDVKLCQLLSHCCHLTRFRWCTKPLILKTHNIFLVGYCVRGLLACPIQPQVYPAISLMNWSMEVRPNNVSSVVVRAVFIALVIDKHEVL